MNPRPGPGTHDQQRAKAETQDVQLFRRPSRPSSASQHVQPQESIDPSLDAIQRATKAREWLNTRVKPEPFDGIDTSAIEVPRPIPDGKPHMFFSSAAGHVSDQKVLPNPPRPCSSALLDDSQLRPMIPGGTGVKGDAATQPPSMEAPALANVFPGGSRTLPLQTLDVADERTDPVDFYPWTGNHPEDVLSEAVVKGGISNKATMNETNTARPSLWPHLKNKSGLHALSAVVLAVLEKRRAAGTVTTPNTFKPPPRLTLRDSTREKWLHDLADPSVSLKRLSRTIPHGVTGRGLLEQCLNKDIPLHRALFLLRAVGINEMRAHKRKGQAGTITWVRGWTSSVEQFLNGHILAIGQQEWKPRVDYAYVIEPTLERALTDCIPRISLTARLYAENLLDDDHFLDWLLTCLENSPTERLLIWVLLASVHWTDLSAIRRHGKRLADALLAHLGKVRLSSYSASFCADTGSQLPLLTEVNDDDNDSNVLVHLKQVRGLVEESIIWLLLAGPLCFLGPKMWPTHHPVLRDLVRRRDNPVLDLTVSWLCQRNNRLVPSGNAPRYGNDFSLFVLRRLDAVDYQNDVSVEGLASECLGPPLHPTALISTALQWASSTFRNGVHRIYLVTRLLRCWSHRGLDIYDGIISHLGASTSMADTDVVHIFRIVAELVRSGTFSMGRHLQWLIATGAAGQCRDLQDPSSWPLRLAIELPTTGAPEAALQLRAMLLRTAHYSTEMEDQLLEEAKMALQTQLGEDHAPQLRTAIDTDALNATLRLEIGIWLRAQVDAVTSVEESSLVCKISSHDFHMVRSYMEEFKDFTILADIIGMVAGSLDGMVLASAADTLHRNHKAFSAIGAFTPLFRRIAVRYAALRSIRLPERELLVSLSDLSRTVSRHDLAQTTQANKDLEAMLKFDMKFDMSLHELKNSVAACSPVSDIMTDSGGNSNLDSDEEVDRILSSGTSMDQQVMARAFDKIVTSVEHPCDKFPQSLEHHASWFWRLRNFDESSFDRLVTRWLESRLLNHQTQAIRAMLPPLVSSGSFKLHRFLSIVHQCWKNNNRVDADGSVMLCVEALHMIIPAEEPKMGYVSWGVYRYHLEQQRACGDLYETVLTLLRSIIDIGSMSSCQSQVTSLLSNPQLRQMVRQYTLDNPGMVPFFLGSGDEPNLKLLLDGLFDPSDNLKLHEKTVEEQVVAIFQSTRALSLPFGQLRLQQIFSSLPTASGSAGDLLSAALLESIKRALEGDDMTWFELVAELDVGLKTTICEHAEREILRASPVVGDAAAARALNEREEGILRKYLLLVDCTASTAQQDGQTQILAMLVERLRNVVEALVKASEAAEFGIGLEGLYTWLGALLHLVVVHIPLLSDRPGHNPQAALLRCLRTLFVPSGVQPRPVVVDHAFDVAIILSDSLSGKARNRLVQLDAAKPIDDSRRIFIFGNSPPGGRGGWLCVSRPHTSALPSQPPSSLPVASHAEASRSAQQATSNGLVQSPNPASMQRSASQQHQVLPQNAGRGCQQYSQQPDSNKVAPQLQRTVSGGQGMRQSQLQQSQHIHQSQQRSAQSSPAHTQQQTGPITLARPAVRRPGPGKPEKPERKTTPFPLRPWEVLPEIGGNPEANDTALSLTLFGSRKL